MKVKYSKLFRLLHFYMKSQCLRASAGGDIFFQSESQNSESRDAKAKVHEKEPEQIQLFPQSSTFPSDFEDRYPSDEIEVSPSMPCLNIQPSCAPNPPHYEDKDLYSYDNFSKYTPFDNSTDKISFQEEFEFDSPASATKSSRKLRSTITEEKLQLLNVIFHNYQQKRDFLTSQSTFEENKAKKMLRDFISRHPELNLNFEEIVSISSISGISGICNLAQSTVLHKYKEFKQNGEVKGGPRMLSKYVKQKYQKSFLIEKHISQALSERPFYSAIELSKYISTKYGVSYSRCLINRHLKEMGFNLNMTPNYLKKINTNQIKEIRHKFVISLQQCQEIMKRDNILFVDQFLFEKQQMTLKSKLQLVNDTSKDKKEWINSNFISVMVAMNEKDVVYFKIKKGIFEKEDFLRGMAELKERMQLGSEEKDQKMVVLDLHPIHIPDPVQKAKTSFRRLYFPPHSPQLNPCMNLFQDLKKRLNQLSTKNRLYDSFSGSVESEMLKISSKTVSQYFFDLEKWRFKAKNLQNF